MVGNRSIRTGVHALRVNGCTDHVSAVNFIHTTLITVRRHVNSHGNVIVSKHSVNAIIFPGTRLGIFIATATRIHTRHHCGRLIRGGRRRPCRRILRGVHRHSCHSARHRRSPLHYTSSTHILSGDGLAGRRRVSILFN